MITNQEVYDNGEIQSIEHSRTVNDVKFYHYTILYYNGIYEIEVSRDEINQEVEFPDSPAMLLQTI